MPDRFDVQITALRAMLCAHYAPQQRGVAIRTLPNVQRAQGMRCRLARLYGTAADPAPAPRTTRPTRASPAATTPLQSCCRQHSASRFQVYTQLWSVFLSSSCDANA
eukprot:7383051-Prymnesium_polylepis.1